MAKEKGKKETETMETEGSDETHFESEICQKRNQTYL